MKRLFQFLWSGCFHVWKEDSRGFLTRGGTQIGAAIICKCTKCGTPKRFDLL